MTKYATKSKWCFGFAVTLGMLLTGLVPAAGASAAVVSPAGPAAAKVAAQADGLLVGWGSTENGNGSARCRIRQSYMKIDYNNPGGRRTRYDIVVRILLGGPGDYADWASVLNGRVVFTTGRLEGPGGPNREGYIFLGDGGASTIAVEAFSPRTDNRIWTGKWTFDLGCGRDYSVNVQDA